ncbi:hypothetical protein FSP39_013879 [Pinctada imbricata]|uniref:Peptidase S9 prolyl oligopeptidase catalytic domain-containing protein n=1 Tax=Pinctada imbricata TaxID=66713 RepID=A0AA88Y6W7_PINIB|nr:hypothetical protein FSP39_013879 [Pinctada imbricata]
MAEDPVAYPPADFHIVAQSRYTLHGDFTWHTKQAAHTAVPLWVNQADSYKRMAEGEYVFGVDNAWLLAPTRHGAHNWEGPGALTALQSLDALYKMVEDSDDIFKVKVDTNKVVYAGHSMGGHGAWHLATHYPDKALALMSLAGWIKKEEYGDSNLFFRHDIATSHADPVTKFIMESCISENDADRHISNIQELPVLTRIGADDRTVHPFFLRRMYRLLAEIGIMVNHTELARKEHWWWDTWKTNDGGAVNDPQLRDFTNKLVSKSLEGGSQCDSIHGNSEEDCGKSEFDRYSQNSMTKREFTLTTYNPALGDGMNGLRVIQQITPLRKSEVHCTVGENTVEIDTVNVAKFSIEKTRNRPIKWSDKSVKINKQPVQIEIGNDISYLCYKSGRWSVCSGIEDTVRGPDTYGPARRIAEQEFVIVVGTQSSNQTITELLLQSAVYIANLFFLTSDTIAPILKDEDIQTSDERNLILLGGTEENLHTTFFLEKLPITFKADGTLTIESCTYHHDRQGMMTLAPHHGNRLAMILFGSSPSGFLDVVSLATPTIPPMTRSPFSNLLPDYVLTGPDFGMKGPGGFLCTGFYVEQRNYSPDAEDVSVIAQHTGGLSGYLGGEYHAPDNSYHIGVAPHVNLNPGSHHVIDGGRVQGGVDLGHGVQLQGHVGGYQGHGVDEKSDSENKYTETDIIQMLNFLIDNIFVVFGGKVFQQIVGIPMGTNCAPLLADIFLYSYEAEFIQSLVSDGKRYLASDFNFTYRYIDDVLSINNPKFADYLSSIYPSELEVKETTETNNSASYLDIMLSYDTDGHMNTSLYDKRDDFNFSITNFPFLSSNIPSSPAYGVFISQLIRYARASTKYTDFVLRARRLSDKLLSQGYVCDRLTSSLRKFYGRYGELVIHYDVPLSRMVDDILS